MKQLPAQGLDTHAEQFGPKERGVFTLAFPEVLIGLTLAFGELLADDGWGRLPMSYLQ